MKVDVDGQVYCTGARGVWVFDKAGKHLGTIVVPEKPSNCAWGNNDRRTLYITAGKSVYSIEARRPGIQIPDSLGIKRASAARRRERAWNFPSTGLMAKRSDSNFKPALLRPLSLLLPTEEQTWLLQACLWSGPAGERAWARWSEGIDDPAAFLRQDTDGVKGLLPLLFHSLQKKNVLSQEDFRLI